MLKVTYEDQEYEFVGYSTSEGTHVLTFTGRLVPRTLPDGVPDAAYFRLVPVRHTFGGVVYEETGEKRSTTVGDCYLDNNSIPHLEIWYQSHNSLTPYTILRPVEVTND